MVTRATKRDGDSFQATIDEPRERADRDLDLRVDPIEEAKETWLARWGEEASRSMATVSVVMRVQQILVARLNAHLKPFRLTYPRYEALMLLYLSRRGSLPLGKIGTRLQVHPTSVTNLIDGLERVGLVQRRPHERDRRATLAEITELGVAVAEEATALLNEARFGTRPLAGQDLDTIYQVFESLRLEADSASS